MEFNIFNTDQVYIRLGEDFSFEKYTLPNLTDIIELVAKSVKTDEVGTPLLNDDGNIFKGRTKRYIVRETNRYISNIAITYECEGMRPTVSYRQMRKLIKAHDAKIRCITSYAFIILYVMFILIKKHSTSIINIQVDNYIEMYKELMSDYQDSHPENRLVGFLLSCYNTIYNRFEHTGDFSIDVNTIPIDDLPPIPRRKTIFEDIE